MKIFQGVCWSKVSRHSLRKAKHLPMRFCVTNAFLRKCTQPLLLAVFWVCILSGTVWADPPAPSTELAAISAALQADPRNVNALNIYGIEQARAGDLIGAIRTWRYAIDLAPGYVHLYNNIGSALRRLGHLSNARDWYQASIRLQATYWTWYNLGLLEEELGQAKEAQKSYGEALRLFPAFTQARERYMRIERVGLQTSAPRIPLEPKPPVPIMAEPTREGATWRGYEQPPLVEANKMAETSSRNGLVGSPNLHRGQVAPSRPIPETVIVAQTPRSEPAPLPKQPVENHHQSAVSRRRAHETLTHETKATEATETTETMEMTEATELLEATEATKATGASEATKAPKATEMAEIPVATEIPQVRLPTDSGGQVFLTFDGGSEAAGFSGILAALSAHHVHATFFLTGHWVRSYPDLGRRILAEGHEIANHSMSHKDMAGWKREAIAAELEKAEDVFRSVLGRRSAPFFRFPFGAQNRRVEQWTEELGYRPVYWNIDTLDWKEPSVGSIINKVVTRIRRGAVVLMHVGSKNGSKALPTILDNLMGRGFRPGKLSDLDPSQIASLPTIGG